MLNASRFLATGPAYWDSVGVERKTLSRRRARQPDAA